MASQTVKTILDAEKSSNQKLLDAKTKRDEIIAKAQKSSEDEYERQLALAKVKEERMKVENQMKIDRFCSEVSQACESQKAELKKQADSRMSDAVNAVIEAFLDK